MPRGTGDAVAAAAALLDPDAPVLVINGDMPLITGEAIAGLVAAHAEAQAGATLASMELDEPAGYGRVVRGADGGVERVVETKVEGDATPEELAIREVNAGLYLFDGGALLAALAELRRRQRPGRALPAGRAAAAARRRPAGPGVPAARPGAGARRQRPRRPRARTRLAQERIHRAHQRAGVTIVDPASTLIEADVTIGGDTTIEPSTFLRGSSRIGDRCTVGPLTTVIDSVLADGVTVRHAYLDGATASDGATVGPFAYLRPRAVLLEDAKVGTFVEVKNSTVGPGSKVPHLSYIGDADIGAGSNIGAGTITANYDGRAKHRTTIGDRVRVSVDTAFVAPVTVGDDAYTAAGSVITDDVPPGALGVARQRQRNIEGYADRKREEG